MTVNYGEGGKLPIRTVEGSTGVTINVGIYKDNKLINSFASKTGTDLLIDAAPGTYIIALTSEYADPLNVSVTVNKGSPKLALVNDFAKSGETANVKISMSKKAAGFVRITINGVTYRQQISSGVASVEVPNLADGAYTVTATYNGNAYHTAETMAATFHVGKFTQGMELVTKNIKVGETERLTANMAKDTPGFVRFIIGEDTYRVAIENGVAYADIKDLKAGTYSVTLKYGGNYKYNAETVSKTFTVSKSSPAINITSNNIKVGQTAAIKVDLAKDAPGNVLITVNGESQKVKITQGEATLALSGLKEGTYNVSAKYAGNYKYNAETKATSFTVSKSSPRITINVNGYKDGYSEKNIKFTDNITIEVCLANDTPGNVMITVNGQSQKTKINNGIAILNLPAFEIGTYEVTVKYAGNYKYNAESKTISFTVYKLTPTMSVSAKTENDITTITAKINSDIKGNLTITYKSKVYTAEIINGEASISINDNLINDYENLYVKYDGNEKYSLRLLTKLMPSISVSANTENGNTIIAVKTSSRGDSSGNLKITYEGKTYNAKITNGMAILTVDGIIHGSHTIKVVTGVSKTHRYISRTLIETITI